MKKTTALTGGLRKLWTAVKRHKVRTVVLLLVAALLLRVILKSADPAMGMTEDMVQERNIVTYNSFVGNVEFASETSVIPKATEEVVELLVARGDTVKKGDVLARLDTSAVEYNIAVQETNLAMSQTSNTYNIKDAKRSYDNYKETLDEGLNSGLLSAQSQVDSTKKSYESAQSNYSDTEKKIENGTYEPTAAAYAARESAKATMDGAAAALEAAKANLAAARNGSVSGSDGSSLADYEQKVTVAQASYDSAVSAYRAAVDAFNSAKSSALSSLSEAVSTAAASYNNAIKNYDSTALSTQQQLASYGDSLNKIRATASTETSEMELEHTIASLADYVITAPCDGTITALDIAEGDIASTSKSVATIADLNTMEISIKVDEYSILNAEVGRAVTVYIDSIDRSYEGVLAWIAESATVSNGVSYFEATVTFTPDDIVRGGMSVEVRLTTVDEKNIPTLPVAEINYAEDNTAYVYVKDASGNPVARQIGLGVSDGTYVEITDGLEAGDTILYVPAAQGFTFPERGN